MGVLLTAVFSVRMAPHYESTPREFFSGILRKQLGICSPNCTCILHVTVYAIDYNVYSIISNCDEVMTYQVRPCTHRAFQPIVDILSV